MAESKRVLVAEDDEQWVRILKQQLETLGCVVDTAGNYCDARKLSDNNQYALIISDNDMPLIGGSPPDSDCGLELLAQTKAHGHNKNTPFVLHTGDSGQRVKNAVSMLGGIYKHKGGEYVGDFLKKLLQTI